MTPSLVPEESCSVLAQILIQQLKSNSFFLRVELLSSLAKVLPKTTACSLEEICQDLIGLCSSLGSDLKCRNQLIDCFRALARKNERFVNISKIVTKFNATRKNLHDPIDFEKRLDAINEVVNSDLTNFSDLLYWKCVLVNALYLYQHIDDLSMQTATSRLLLVIMRGIKMAEDQKAFDLLVKALLLSKIRKMLKSRVEKVRFEFVILLKEVITLFDDAEISDLKCLQDENAEVDFFENVTHIQLHRRQRAFNRAKNFIEERRIGIKCSERYLFPLALSTLIDPKLEKQTQLLQASLDLLGEIAKIMSWSSFRRLLDIQLGLAAKAHKEDDPKKACVLQFDFNTRLRLLKIFFGNLSYK